MKLYELSKDLAIINDELITAEGEITPGLEARLDAVNLALAEKATGIRKWFAKIETDADALDKEIARLKKMRDLNDKLTDRLKDYIKQNMETADLKKIETPIGTFSIQKSPDSVEILDPLMIPAEYKESRVVVDISKAKLKDALKAGANIPGAALNSKTHLRIK